MDVALRERGVYAFGPFKLDPMRRTLLCDGATVTLTARLFETLLYLVQHPERLVERDELQQAVWNGRVVEDGNLQKAISSLRKALQTHGPAETYIVTVSGRGFQFSAPVAFEPYETEAPPNLTFTHAQIPAKPRSKWRSSLTWSLPILLLAATAAILWRSAPRAIPSAAFTPPPHSVAVLAFANMSGDARQDYFSDGLADELINTLSRIGDLRVAARTSAFSFKGTTATIADIARRLNVAAILEGSVRLDGQRVHISVQLIDARTGFQSWSRSYDKNRLSGDMLQVQTDIADAVTSSLEIQLMDTDAAKLQAGSTHNAHAFDAYLRGMNNNQQFDDANARQAIEDFTEAIALDPAYAQAFAGRAIAHHFRAIASYGTDASLDRQEADAALADANRAIALAPLLAEAHRVKGLILFSALDFAGSAKEIARASDLAPDNATIEATQGTIEARLGHSDLALEAARHAISLDPLNPGAYRGLGQALYWTGHFKEALEAFGHAAAVDKHPSRITLSWLASAYLAQGDPAAAEHICAGGNAWTDDVCLAVAYHELGRQADADAELEALHKTFGDRAAYVDAEIYAKWGRPADALRCLETAYARRDNGLTEMKVSPFLDPLRSSPEFKAIENRLNFPP